MVSASRPAIGAENRIREDLRERLFCLPRGLFEVLHAVRDAGGRAWLCGGTVRDLLQGRIPRDLDLAMTLVPDEALRAFPRPWLQADQPGMAMGSLSLAVASSNLEVTTLRREASYSDGRRPDSVTFVQDPEQDYLRRDFTVNGMYLDPIEGEFLDPSGGYGDLAAGRLRTIGDPRKRFAEDHLRLLRAVRFCSSGQLVMDGDTWQALVETAARSASVSPQRVLHELQGIFQSEGRARGLMMLVESGLAAVHLPTVPPLACVPQPSEFHPEGDVLRHTALVLAFLPEPVSKEMAWAAVFHDTGKKDTFENASDRIRFHDHDRVSTVIAEEWLRRYGASNRLISKVVALIREHIRFAALPGFRVAKRNAFLQDPLFESHLEFHRADCLGSHRKLDIYEEMRRQKASARPGPLPPLVRGRDLIGIGVPPGPAMGGLLSKIAEERAEGRLKNAEDALKYARCWLDGHQG